jgi:hypothetical protein
MTGIHPSWTKAQLDEFEDNLVKARRAAGQLPPTGPSQPTKPTKPRRQRKPSMRALLAQAEKAGRHVRSMTMPDGTVLTFGEPEAADEASSNPWLVDLATRRAKR